MNSNNILKLHLQINVIYIFILYYCLAYIILLLYYLLSYNSIMQRRSQSIKPVNLNLSISNGYTIIIIIIVTII